MKFKSIFLSSLLAMALSVSSSCNGHDKKTVAATPADQMRERLTQISHSGKTMLGHHDDTVYGHDWIADSCRSDVLETAGDYPAMMSWDLGALELGKKENLDGVPFDRMAREVVLQHERGGFNTFSWHLFSPVDSVDCWTIGDSLTVSRILDDKVVNSKFREQVRSLARFFNGLIDANGNRIPVIFRPFHEHTGSWFWWGKPYTTPLQYNNLWQIITDEFTAAGVDNVLYAYSTDRVSTRDEYLEYYPGDDVVDIVGADIYHFNGNDGCDDYRATVDSVLAIVSGVAAERGKIAAFTETGCESIPVDNWWTDMLLPLLKQHPMCYVVLWRNAFDKPEHFYVPYASHPSEVSFKTFCNDSTILLVKDLK